MELTTISVVRRYKIRRALKQIKKKFYAYEGKETLSFWGEIEELVYTKHNNPDIINAICKKIIEALPGIREVFLFSPHEGIEEVEESLNKGIIPETLKKEFEEIGVSLSDNVRVMKGKEDNWVIADEEEFIVKKEGDKLNVYNELKKEVYLFSWDSLPGNDAEKLQRYLRDYHNIDWAKNAEISKSRDGKTIRLSKMDNSAEIRMDVEDEKATLKINGGNTHELTVKKENGMLNIYKEVDFGPLEKVTYKAVISGYFKAAFLFRRAYRKFHKLEDKNNADSCMTKFTDLLEQRGYFREMGKIKFEAILKESNFKTGPLLESDIKDGELYLETLHENANDYLEDILRATGCHGISGERGMGKSTLINTFETMAKAIPDRVVIKMSMPTEYKDEEFLTALFLKFCDATKESIKKTHPYSFIIGLLDIPSFAYHYIIPIVAITALIALFLSEFDSGDFTVTHFTLIVLVLAILSMLILLRLVFCHLNKRIKTYYEIVEIDNDIRYKKTLEIKEGVGPQLFMLGKTSTFKDNPVKYSGPLLSERLKETIEKVAKFSKVIFLIDDLDKQEGIRKIRRILKNLRFLSSVKNCLTIVSVRAELADEFKDKDSEVRTLFDDIWKLRALKEDKLIELINRRIIFGEFADKFLKKEEIIRNYKKFWDTLLKASDKVPREAIRLFRRSFQHWFEKPDITLDEALEEKKPKQLRIVRATERPKELRISYESGSAIDLREVKMILEVNKKRTTVSPVAEGNEEERFAVHDTMVIDMGKLIARGDNAITTSGKPTGVTVGTISEGIALSDWKKGNTVGVTLVYVPTEERLMADEKNDISMVPKIHLNV